MRRVIVGLLVLLAVGVVVGGLLILTSGGSSNKKTATHSTADEQRPGRTAPQAQSDRPSRPRSIRHR